MVYCYVFLVSILIEKFSNQLYKFFIIKNTDLILFTVVILLLFFSTNKYVIVTVSL